MTDEEMRAVIRKIAADLEAQALEFFDGEDISVAQAEKILGPILDGYQAELLAQLRRDAARQNVSETDSPSGDKKE